MHGQQQGKIACDQGEVKGTLCTGNQVSSPDPPHAPCLFILTTTSVCIEIADVPPGCVVAGESLDQKQMTTWSMQP